MHVLEVVASEQWVFIRIVEKSDGTPDIEEDFSSFPSKLIFSDMADDTVLFG